MATRTTKKAAVEATEVKGAKAAAVVETAETTEKKAAPKKAAAAKKETAVKEAAPVKKEAAVKEAAPAKKEAAVKEAAPAKKETAQKGAAHTEPEVSVVFECGGKQIVAKDVLAKAMDAFRAAHADVEIKEMKLYVNAEDSCAYIVVNGEEYPDDKVYIM